MTPAELRLLTELNRDLRRAIDRPGKHLEVMAIGGSCHYGGGDTGPKRWRFSKAALISLTKNGMVALERHVGGSCPADHYWITDAGRQTLAALGAN
jgi:hypothetical protein